MPEGFLVDRSAEHGDDAVCKEEIYRRQNQTACHGQHHRIAHTALCSGGFPHAQRHADEGAAAVTNHDGYGQRHHRQRKHHGVGGVAVRAEVAGVGNENLVNDVVQCPYQQRDNAGNGVAPHEPADRLRSQKLMFRIHKMTLPKNKMRNPANPDLRISAARFSMDGLLPDRRLRFRKKDAAFLQPDLRRNATRCTAIIHGGKENFKWSFRTKFRGLACRRPQ